MQLKNLSEEYVHFFNSFLQKEIHVCSKLWQKIHFFCQIGFGDCSEPANVATMLPVILQPGL